jgi:hypothetical protein
MPTRTVRLDADAKKTLGEIRAATGLRVSEALKRGLRALRAEIARETTASPWDIYREIDLGGGGVAAAPSTRVKPAVRRAIRAKIAR